MKDDMNNKQKVFQALNPRRPMMPREIHELVPEISYESLTNYLRSLKNEGKVVYDKKEGWSIFQELEKLTPPRQHVATGTYLGTPMVTHRPGAMEAFKQPSRVGDDRLEYKTPIHGAMPSA